MDINNNRTKWLNHLKAFCFTLTTLCKQVLKYAFKIPFYLYPAIYELN